MKFCTGTQNKVSDTHLPSKLAANIERAPSKFSQRGPVLK